MHIEVRGARLHNLREVDVDLPHGRLIAVTGVSGSGKSSLAFGTVHGEAQRRSLETVAPYARRLLEGAIDPQVREIRHLPPTSALQQHPASATSRSSVATLTRTGSTLRMLLSRCGDYPPGAPRLDSDRFSPDTAVGACPGCGGLGTVHEPTEASMVPDRGLSIAQGAIAAWPGAWQGKNYRDIVATLGHDVDAPWHELPQATRDWILFTDDQPVVTVVPERDPERINRPYQGTFSSARRYLLRTLAETRSTTQRARALRHVETRPCSTCNGRGLHPDALAVTWQGLAIDEALALPAEALAERVDARLAALPATGEDAVREAERALLADLRRRLGVLVELGLGHLALGRASTTVSTGELQRLRLGALLHSSLYGVVHVLDEPSAGLHPQDTAALMGVLRRLVDSGSTVLVVEHDLAVVDACDHIVDLGPGAGSEGGEVLFAGTLEGFRALDAGDPDSSPSPTRRYLTRPVHPEEILDGGRGGRSGSRDEGDGDGVGGHPRPSPERGELRLAGLRRHSVQGVDVTLPLGALTVVTGVSGSGKSSLLDAVHDAVAAHLQAGSAGDVVALDEGDDETRPEEAMETEPPARPGGGPAAEPAQVSVVSATSGSDLTPTRLVRLTQRPIGRTPRSNLATYTGLFDRVRRAFAATEQARAAGFGAGRFSFNTPEGRCPQCEGQGAVEVELLFMPGTYATCPACHGARYDEQTLGIRLDGRSIADVLALTVREARQALAGDRQTARTLEVLDDLGLGYLTLGQPATELSGGEAQRIKLATELQRTRPAPTLYVLDEPTTGLHPADVHRLLRQLHALAAAGHTVLLAEHDAAAVATAVRVVEMGPGAGPAGGRIVRRPDAD